MAKNLFTGGRLESIKVLSGVVSDNTPGGWYNTTYSDNALDVGGGVAQVPFYDPASAPLLVPYSVPSGHSLYFHLTGFWQNNPNNFYVQLNDSSGNPWVRCYGSGQMMYNSGTGASPVWTNLGTSAGQIAFSTAIPIDIKIDIAAGGTHTATLFYANVQVMAPTTFTASGMTNLSSAILTGSNLIFSEIMATEDLSTIGGHVFTKRAAGAGTHTDWAGTYTDINEQVTNDNTINQATTAGLVQTYPMANVALPNGYAISSVFNWVRAKNNGNAPVNIKSVVRRGGTDYTSGNLSSVGVGFGGAGARYDVDPSTSAAWTQAGWNAPVEVGFASAT